MAWYNTAIDFLTNKKYRQNGLFAPSTSASMRPPSSNSMTFKVGENLTPEQNKVAQATVRKPVSSPAVQPIRPAPQSPALTSGQVAASSSPMRPPEKPTPSPALAQLTQEADNIRQYGTANRPPSPIKMAMEPAPAAPAPASAPAAPAANPQLEALKSRYLASLGQSQEEIAAQKAIDDLAASKELGIAATAEQPIEMGFITGQQAAIERRAALQSMPLSARLAAIQAQRAAERERAKAEYDMEAGTENKPIEVGGSLVQLNPATGQYESVYSAPAATEKPVTLGEGQTLVDPSTGEVIASGAAKSESLPSSYREWQLAGSPGNYKDWAKGTDVKNLTVDQSKARQFATAAQNADAMLDSYDPGMVELPLPNQLKSPERQVFEQAARAFVNSVLRRESGATITDSEYSNKFRELIPQAGDSALVKQQKKLARAAAVASIQEAGLMGAGGTAGTQGGDNDFDF